MDSLVHCRIGSSEMLDGLSYRDHDVHCRIGSSENSGRSWPNTSSVHCRIGSSENGKSGLHHEHVGSLPHRQLRK